MNPEDLAAVPPARLPFAITRATPEAVEARSEDPTAMPTMSGHFSTFGDWYEVDSWIEGHFMESVGRRAFDKTISETRDQMKVLYDHGQDPSVGNKVLGPIDDLRTDKTGPKYTVPLFDTSYNRDLAPGLVAGVYGSSFRFTVEKDVWDHSPTASEHNPAGIPERTITEARVYEFGPVTFPANPKATAGARSTTDDFYQRSRDPEQFEALLRSAQAARTPARSGAAAPPPEPADDTPPEEPPPVTPQAPDDPPQAAAPDPEDPPEGGSPDSRSETVDLTIDEKRARVDELNDYIERTAGAFPGVLPETEQPTWDASLDERSKLRKDIEAYDTRQAAVERNGADPAKVERAFAPPTDRNVIVRKSERELHSPESRASTPEGQVAEFRDDAKRILERTSFPPNLTSKTASGDRIEYLLDHADSEDGELARRIKYTSSPEYMRAFEKIIKAKGSTIGLTPDEQRGTALAVGVDATGGFAVPFAFDPTVIAIGVNNGAVNPYRAACRVVSIVGTDTWNAVTATAVVATRTTEAAASTEQGPTFAQPQYIVKRVQGQITASFEMFQDRNDLGAEMAGLIQEAKDNEEETSWATGNGSGSASIGVGPVTGTAGSYTRVSTAGAGAFAAGDFDSTEAALPVRHRFRAQWFGNRLNIRRAQALETTGGKLFQQSQFFQSAGNVNLSRDGNTGLRLLGYPVNESPSLPTSTATTITGLVLLNVDQYVIVDRVGLSVQFIPFILNSSSLATGQQALYFLYRNHAAPLNTDSGRILQYL